MSAESVSNLKFEIGHVLFIDIVGYSKLLITEQSELLRRLTDVVRETEQFRAACKVRFFSLGINQINSSAVFARDVRFFDGALIDFASSVARS
jgi:hypothetical protein